jgi:hypothetical protein
MIEASVVEVVIAVIQALGNSFKFWNKNSKFEKRRDY